jgi:hypothetical protein
MHAIPRNVRAEARRVDDFNANGMNDEGGRGHRLIEVRGTAQPHNFRFQFCFVCGLFQSKDLPAILSCASCMVYALELRLLKVRWPPDATTQA